MPYMSTVSRYLQARFDDDMCGCVDVNAGSGDGRPLWAYAPNWRLLRSRWVWQPRGSCVGAVRGLCGSRVGATGVQCKRAGQLWGQPHNNTVPVTCTCIPHNTYGALHRPAGAVLTTQVQEDRRVRSLRALRKEAAVRIATWYKGILLR